MPIEVKNLNHVYMRGTPFESCALKNICMRIEDGEFIGIIGHTGSGKSTLISYFNGLNRAEPGVIFVNGEDLGAKDRDILRVRRTVGLVFQYPEYQLFGETVEKDIAFGPKNLGLPEAEVQLRVTEAMQMMGLSETLKNVSPFDLSGGQKRRAAIAGILAMRPSVLVLDEPAAGLDPQGRREMLELVKRIHASGVTVVMVSHSMDDVGKLCDRLFVMNQGEIVLEGKPADVFAHDGTLRRIGLDVPECARLAKALREKGFQLPEGLYSLEHTVRAILEELGVSVG
ncbi:MAG: energy-coupling factor transporter ATPase [Christensenellales bacterium]|nr:energy-coupling factor transporter ATPase [Christensenellales bacterium]